jgi:hypothetical protein
MSFLDRFKTQPKYRHPDPAIRLAGVAELPDDAEHWGVIAELAASDEDVRVRRAALERIGVVGYLARIARTERDESLRRELAERLIGIANAPADSDGDAAAALDGLSDQKQFGTIAKSSPHDTVRTAALGKIHDVKVLASVARHAVDAHIALEAVARVTDQAELVAVATKTDHKDAGIAALERAADATTSEGDRRALLDGVAGQAKNKSIAKRARALVLEMDEAEAARKAALEEWRKRGDSVIARLDAIANAPGATDADTQIDETVEQWLALTEAPDSPLADRHQQFNARLAEVRAAIETQRREEAERRAEAERAAARLAALVAICERVDTLRGEDTPDELERARAEWEGMPGAAAQEREDAELRARFDESCRRATERHQNRQALERVHTRLGELSLEADRLALPDDSAAGGETPEDRTQKWRAVAEEWQSLAGQADGLDETIAARFVEAQTRVRQREDEKRAAAERTLKQQVQRVEQLLERVTARAAAEDLNLREADRAVRDLKSAMEAPPAVPAREQHALVERIKAAMAVMAPKLHDLREMDEWKRFANAAVQEELIAKVEALRAKYSLDGTSVAASEVKADGTAEVTPPKPEDIEKAAHELHEIQERWKQVAEAPRAQAQALWHRYRQAADPIQVKAREFFAQRAEERGANLKLKMVLIERAEALADSTDWIKTADELKKLQAEWQQVGPVPRQDTKMTWKRFRDACDRFFTRRNADLNERKETWTANLAKKDALCARAEELASAREWERAASEIRRLQAEWKTIGPVRRTKSEAIWQRFRTACDTFFDRYKRRDEIELEAKHADREALVVELEALAAPSINEEALAAPSIKEEALAAPSIKEEALAAPAAIPSGLLERVRSLRTRWNQTTPVVRQGADPLSARFIDALARLLTGHPEAFKGTELDVEASRQKMEKLCARVEGFLADAAPAPAGSQALAEMLREALASNTIGGKAGEEAKWRAMADEVRQAQASWSRLGPVPGDTGRQLTERFHKACNRFFEQLRRKVPPTPSQPPRGRPVGAR